MPPMVEQTASEAFPAAVDVEASAQESSSYLNNMFDFFGGGGSDEAVHSDAPNSPTGAPTGPQQESVEALAEVVQASTAKSEERSPVKSAPSPAKSQDTRYSVVVGEADDVCDAAALPFPPPTSPTPEASDALDAAAPQRQLPLSPASALEDEEDLLLAAAAAAVPTPSVVKEPRAARPLPASPLAAAKSRASDALDAAAPQRQLPLSPTSALEDEEDLLLAAAAAAVPTPPVVKEPRAARPLPASPLAAAKSRVSQARALLAAESCQLQERAKFVAIATKHRALRLQEAVKQAASTRKVQVVAASAACGGAVLGSCSAATGFVAGGAVGAFLGLVPALFTLGLSIPVGATLGAGAGACAGAAAGGAVGAAGAGAASHGVYSHRDEITHAAKSAAETVATCKDSAQVSVQRVGARVRIAAAEPQYQVTAAAAATGAAVGVAGGATVGLVSGGAVGAAVGVIPAPFTMGLSIPVGAAIGSGAGACVGSVMGAASGLLGGGAAGYGAYAKRSELRGIAATAAGWADRMQTEAVKSREFVKEKATTGATYMRRCLAGGTGGTD